jgi:hypothetical protein
MGTENDSFFEGLDDAEDVPASEASGTPAAEAPDVKEPADAPAEKAEKPEEKPAEKPAEAAPEVKAEKPVEKQPLSEKPEQPNPRDWVPVGAHVELKRMMKAMQEELHALKNPPKLPPPKPELPAQPDFAQDPKGYVDHTKVYVDHKVQAALEQLESGQKQATQTAEQAAAQAAETRFFTALTAAEQQFVAQKPDYFAALDHLRGLRAQEILLFDPSVTQEQMKEILYREEKQLATNILRTGRNPSEVAYNLARARGYAPKPAVDPKPAEPEKKPEPAAKILPDIPDPKKLPPDLTLGTGTGSPITGDDANEDAFEAAWKEVFGQRKRA